MAKTRAPKTDSQTDELLKVALPNFLMASPVTKKRAAHCTSCDCDCFGPGPGTVAYAAGAAGAALGDSVGSNE